MSTAAIGRNQIRTMDSSPKWFTEVELDLGEGWTYSTIERFPTIELDETPFTRVEFEHVNLSVIPSATPDA